jgi:hypothetical protein
MKQPLTTAQEQGVSESNRTNLRIRRRLKKTTSQKNTLNYKTRLKDRKDRSKFRFTQTQGNQANSECDADKNSNESKLPAAIGKKIDRIKSIDMLEKLRDIISNLRFHTCPLLTVMQKSAFIKLNRLRNLPSFTHKLLLLKEELELNELNEQIYKLRKKIALAEFFDTYSAA